MSAMWMDVLLWAAAVSSGLMAGVYCAFSTFIMPAFRRLEGGQGAVSMVSINEVILRSWFMPLFFGSTLLSVLLVTVALFFWDGIWSLVQLIAGLVYLLGMFVCTAAFNVPLNNALVADQSGAGGSGAVWEDYLERWTRWNHVRSFSSTLSCGLCCLLLAV